LRNCLRYHSRLLARLFVLRDIYPKNRYLYLYRNVIDVAKSTDRLSYVLPTTLWYMQLWYPRAMNDWMGHGGADFIDVYFLDNLTYSAVRALATMKPYVDFRRQGFDISAIRYEDLIARPFEICQRLMEACGLPASLAQKAIRGMQEDSQKDTEAARNVLRNFPVAEVTPEIIESMNGFAAKYGLPPVNEECILEGTLA